MIGTKKVRADAVENQLAFMMESMLKDIYSNKSSDEYKSHGDITKSDEYSTIERMVADVSTLKNLPTKDIREIKTLFQTLHRPIFNKMVSAYIVKPAERNTIFTTVYTVGYRVLIAELSRIFSSTEATDKGLVYKPDKISRRNDMSVFIQTFNSDLEKKIDEYIRSTKVAAPVQEGAVDITASIKTLGTSVLGFVDAIISSVGKVNPVSFIGALLSNYYDSQVNKLIEISALYEETKKAYNEYIRLPEHDRKKRVESNYAKNIEKYNIKMQNMSAKLKHYDQRAIEAAKDKSAEAPKNETPKNVPSTTDSSSGGDGGNEDDVKF